MRGAVVVDQSVAERAEDGDKEKKKKRRSHRRKQNSSLSACSSNNEIRGEGSQCLVNDSRSNLVNSSMSYSPSKQYGVGSNLLNDRGFTKASDVAFNSMPTMHINEQVDPMEDQNMQSQSQFPPDLGGEKDSKSCPVAITCQEPVGSFTNKDFLPSHQIEGYALIKHFAPHWSMEAVNEALEKGDAFKALFHVNAHNKLEAYCKIDGVPTDILISGFPAQNRAVEGDIVAVKVDPLLLWTRMKGSAGIIPNSASMEDNNLLPEVTEMVGDSCKGKKKIDADYEYDHCGNCIPLPEEEFHHGFYTLTGERPTGCSVVNGHYPSASDDVHVGCSSAHNEVMNAVGKLCAMISSFPWKRPTGKVVAIIVRSPRRDAVVGFLGVKQWLSYREFYRKVTKKNKNSLSLSDDEYIQLSPTDPKFPKMVVPMKGLTDCIRKRLKDGDMTVEMELVAARIDDWEEVSPFPQAYVMDIFGRGGEIEPHIAAILFENAICSSEFSNESLSCLPSVPWEVPLEEFKSRRDLRNVCIFTIDPSTATDLDDALSVESLSGGIFRVGVHIADASYFVLPDSALDIEAQIRASSVYMLQRKLSMLPSLLSENLGSLIPGVDRLTFSIFWDINHAGDVVDRWIGRTIIRSSCKLSYEHAQGIIDGLINVESVNSLDSSCPQLHGHFGWPDVIRSVKSLHEISKILKNNRFNDGALQLESSKVVYLFDENGVPYDSLLCEQKDSNYLVEEFMLLANRTAAEVISRTFPDSALLRRHPEPNFRKLREFEAFCSKHGLELDTSSSGQIHQSLERIRENLKNDSVLFDILISYASRPMQLATYFSSGDLKDSENDWSHYALAVPLYTHFTSPLRRYPDIVVHRTLAAAIEAEEMYLKHPKTLQQVNQGKEMKRCFSGFYFDKDAVESVEGREALSAAALKHRVPSTEMLADVATYCNQRKLASRHAEDACDRLYMWALLKNKKILFSEARVLGLGPRFMSIYIHKLSIERRIYYDEVEGLMVEWLDSTSTLVLSFCMHKRCHRRSSPGKCKSLEDVALVVRPYDLRTEMGEIGDGGVQEHCATLVRDDGVALQDPEPISKSDVPDIIEGKPAVFPLTVGLLSTIPVALHAVGGDDGPLDIGVRLYMSSYFG